MTDKMAAEAEIKATLQWFSNESTKICQKLDEEQGENRKFDGGNEPYRELHAEFARRMKEIGKKYGLSEKKTLAKFEHI